LFYREQGAESKERRSESKVKSARLKSREQKANTIRRKMSGDVTKKYENPEEKRKRRNILE
jgi:hypothetical protein